jgi:hypothetical protein
MRGLRRHEKSVTMWRLFAIGAVGATLPDHIQESSDHRQWRFATEITEDTE